MSAADVLRFVAGALRGHRLRSGLTLLAMAIGVAAVVVLTALGEGARRYVTGEFASLGSYLLIVLPGRAETTGGPPPLLGETERDLTIADAMALDRAPAVRRVAPLNFGTAILSAGGREREVPVLGSTRDMLEIQHLEMASGDFLPAGDPETALPVVVLGAKVREEIFGRGRALGQAVRLGDRRFRVIGVMASRGRSLGLDRDEMVIVPAASAEALFNITSLFRVLVEARSRDSIQLAREQVLSIIRSRHDGKDDVTVITQDAVLAAFDRILGALTYTLAGIAAISLSVAGVLVMNVMLVSVAERTPEVGLLKAIGAPPRQILALFLAEAALLSAAGGLAGVLAGHAGAWLIQQVYPALDTRPPAWAIAASLGTAIVAGLLFGVLPARRAARLEPVGALSRR
ncbi:MAG: ABC transporter permease [Acidobacteria bacterium]|nr:ABC transporter permease [Acidobacteriota bacterium]